MTGAYDDILNLPRPVSRNRARMSPLDRAAQFSPFAALTGYEAAVEETARLTDSRIELDVDARVELDEKLGAIRENLASRPMVTVTYFVPDHQKAGGVYATTSGVAEKLNILERWLQVGKIRIPLDDVLSIEEGE